VAIHDQSRHFVDFVGDQRLVEKAPQRHIGQDRARRHALGSALGDDAGQSVTRALRAGFRQQILQIGKM